MKHTKGEWKYKVARLAEGQPAFGYTISVNGKASFLASAGVYEPNVHAAPVKNSELHKDMFSQEEIEANAKLIAAAPELLEALKDIIQWHSDKPTGHGDGHLLGNTISFLKAKAAIKKATE